MSGQRGHNHCCSLYTAIMIQDIAGTAIATAAQANSSSIRKEGKTCTLLAKCVGGAAQQVTRTVAQSLALALLVTWPQRQQPAALTNDGTVGIAGTGGAKSLRGTCGFG